MKEDLRKVLEIRMLLSGIIPEVNLLIKGQVFKNAVRTGDDKTVVGDSWRDYWQMFTQQDFPTICPFCGMPMTEAEVDGCHIKVAGVLNGSWSAKKYIIPGHHRCNMQQGEEFVAKIAVKAVEAIEK